MVEAYNEDGRVYYRKYYISTTGISIEASILRWQDLPRESPVENYLLVENKLYLSRKVPAIDQGFDTLPTGITQVEFSKELRLILDEGVYKGAKVDERTYSPNDSENRMVIVGDGTYMYNGVRVSEPIPNAYSSLSPMLSDFLDALIYAMYCKDSEKYAKYMSAGLIPDSNIQCHGSIDKLPTSLDLEGLLFIRNIYRGGN